jgi:flavin reductase (DIM6/NTAB) family NADH-FMN oxidoreductase RutF
MTADIHQAPDEFIRIGVKDNFYQSSAFIPMSFALVTTVHASGETGIGPHALLAPFGISAPHSMLLISRGSSGTAANIRRTGQCALNYVEHEPERLQGIATLGYPGQSLAAKQKANPYTLMDAPAADAPGGERPQIVAEACQVFECTWDRDLDIDAALGQQDESAAAHFVLRIDRILLKSRYVAGLDDGTVFPKMPIFYGFRAGGAFWFAEHDVPFAVPIPKVEGQELQAVVYLANRVDERIRFTDAACKRLTGVPRPFLQEVLQAIVNSARELGIETIDTGELERINAHRNPAE